MSAASAFAGLGERVPDPIDMQRAMCPRSIPAVHAMISPRGPKVGICALLTAAQSAGCLQWGHAASLCRLPRVEPLLPALGHFRCLRI